MDAYPDVPQSEDNYRSIRSGLRVKIGANNMVGNRPLATSMRGDPMVVHKMRSIDDLNTILAFEAAHRGSQFLLNYVPGSADPVGAPLLVTCVFDPRGIEATPYAGVNGVSFDITVYMLESRATDTET